MAAERMLSTLPLSGHETILDAGCGSDRITEIILKSLPAGKVIAVDLSSAMVEKTRDYLAPTYGAQLLPSLE